MLTLVCIYFGALEQNKIAFSVLKPIFFLYFIFTLITRSYGRAQVFCSDLGIVARDCYFTSVHFTFNHEKSVR